MPKVLSSVKDEGGGIDRPLQDRDDETRRFWQRVREARACRRAGFRRQVERAEVEDWKSPGGWLYKLIGPEHFGYENDSEEWYD